MEELKKKIEKLEYMKYESIEDIEEKPPTTLDKRMLEIGQEIWQEILQIAKKEKIGKVEKFDKKYPIMAYGLQNWIEEYANHLFYCSEMDDQYIEKEIQFLKEALNQFDLEEDLKQEYEIYLIRDLHVVGKVEEANKTLEKWIKNHPEEGEGYEIKCEWELEKKNPNMEKVAEILDEAEDNGTYVMDEEIYEQVVDYYKEIKNDELADYYESLSEFARQDYMDDDVYDIFEEEMEKEVIEELQLMAKDKVEKNKTFEEYIEPKKDEKQLISVLGAGFIIQNSEKIKQIDPKKIKQYLLENRDEILKNNLMVLPEKIIKALCKKGQTGWIEVKIEKEECLEQLEVYMFLLQIGIAFAQYQNKKVIFHIPEIKKIKQLLKQEEILTKNQEFNEKSDCLLGMCEVYGAIKAKELYHIFKKMFKMTEEEFAKILLIAKAQFTKIEMGIEEKTGNIQMVYHEELEEKQAEEIIKSQKELKEYTKEEYMNYGKNEYVQKTKGYQKLKKEFNSNLLKESGLFEVIVECIVQPYLYLKRIEGKQADSMLEEKIEEIFDCGEPMMEIFINKNNIKKAIKQIGDEIPLWKE